jgi:hypothetical protein
MYFIGPNTMLMNAKAIFLAVGAYAAITLLGKKSDAGKLSYGIASVNPSLDGITPILDINLSIQNPTNSNFSIRSFVGSITSNGSTIGTTSNYQTQNILPLSTSYYKISLRMSLIGIAVDVYNAIQGGSGWAQQIEIKGNANVDGYIAPVDLKYQIG